MVRDAERLTGTGSWALRIERQRAQAAAALRTHPGVRCLWTDDALWLRGAVADEDMLRRLDSLPRAQRFFVDEHEHCHRPGELLPATNLPTGPWQELRDVFPPELSPPALAAAIPAGAELTVRRTPSSRQANLLHTSLPQLERWLATAAEVRFANHRFCVNADGEVLVHGSPLPPLPGPIACEQHGVALPAGHRFLPDVPHDLVAATLQLETGDLASFDSAGRVTIVAARQFVPLRRSAVRATLSKLQTP